MLERLVDLDDVAVGRDGALVMKLLKKRDAEAFCDAACPDRT